MNVKSLFVFVIFASVNLFANIAQAAPYCRLCPFDCSTLGLGRKDCSTISSGAGTCCVDLTQRGIDVARAQDIALNGNAAVQQVQEVCPAGFRPSEQKCSQDERRRGCKDIRLPGGLGCVNR